MIKVAPKNSNINEHNRDPFLKLSFSVFLIDLYSRIWSDVVSYGQFYIGALIVE